MFIIRKKKVSEFRSMHRKKFINNTKDVQVKGSHAVSTSKL